MSFARYLSKLAALLNSSGQVTASGLVTDADFTINGLRVGRGAGGAATNTVVGSNALAVNTTGAVNVAVGESALAANTDGGGNVALGRAALAANTTASYNTAVGYYALTTNTTAQDNTAVGFAALRYNTTGASNTALGRQALQANTTASNNTAVGYQAGYSATTAGSGTYIGEGAGYSTTTGGNNTYVGRAAGYSGTTAYHNTCIGMYTGWSLTTGFANTFIGNFYGAGCGYYVTTGYKNTILGNFSGNQGGIDIRTANNYIVLSDGDGNPRYSQDNLGRAGITASVSDYTLNLSVPSGQQWNLLYFRKDGALPSTTGVNLGYVGYDLTNSRMWVLNNGTGGVYLSAGGTSWTSASDERLKENLVPIENGLSKVCSLRSVIGNFIDDETKKQKPFLIAQDVQEVLPEAVSHTTLKDDPEQVEYLGVSYTEVIPLLVAAIKELNSKVEAQAAEIAALKGN